MMVFTQVGEMQMAKNMEKVGKYTKAVRLQKDTEEMD